jgi:hypothetical protein
MESAVISKDILTYVFGGENYENLSSEGVRIQTDLSFSQFMM